MKKILLTIATTVLLASAGYCQNQPLQVTVKSNKQVYEVGEKVILSVEFKNISKETINRDDYYKPGPISFYFKNESDQGYHNISLIDVLRRIIPVEFTAGQSVQSGQYGLNLLKPDNYKLLTGMESYNILGNLEVYMVDGNLTSNTITIKVIGKKLSKEAIIKIAKNIPYNLKQMESIYDEGNQLWNKEWNRRRSYFGNLPEVYPLLVGKNYQAIYFGPKKTKGLRAAGVWVFVDRDNGEMITFQEEAN